MTTCAYCGDETDGRALCPHHSLGYEDDWARANRIMCNFIHRGVVTPIADEDAILHKPFDPDDLVRTVQTLLK